MYSTPVATVCCSEPVLNLAITSVLFAHIVLVTSTCARLMVQLAFRFGGDGTLAFGSGKTLRWKR